MQGVRCRVRVKGAGCRDLVGDFVVGLLVGRQRLLLLFDRLVQLVRLGRLPFELPGLVIGMVELPFVTTCGEVTQGEKMP